MKRTINNFIFLLLVLLFASSLKMSGVEPKDYVLVVVDEAETPIVCFNVSVVKEDGSSVVSVQVGFDGRVSLSVDEDLIDQCYVLVQCIGYKDEQCRLSRTQQTTIILHPDKLAAAVVKGHSSPVEVNKGKILVDVSKSYLKALPESSDILMRVPGLRLSGTELSVVGKGTPLILIDGMESSVDDLLKLQPSRIASISLDRNPDSQYDAESHSVLVVKTSSATGPSVQISNHTYFGRKVSNQTSLDATYSKDKILQSFQYVFTNQNHYDHVQDYDAIKSPVDTIEDRVGYSPLYWSDTHSFQYGGKWSISKPHSLSWQYTGKFSKGGNSYGMSESITSSKSEDLLSDVFKKTSSSNNRFDLIYSWQIDSTRTIAVSSQYVLYKPESSQRIVYESQQDPLSTKNESTSQSLTLKAEYTADKDWASIKTGVRYGSINSDSDSRYLSSDYSTRFSSNLFGIYGQMESEYDTWGWSAGLRCEGLYDEITEYADNISREEWKLFPSLELYTSGLTDWLDIDVSYTGRVRRPSLSELSATYQYVNSIVVSSGNPSLKSSRTDDIQVDFTLWGNLDLCLDAIRYTNPTIEAGELQGNMVLFHPLNVDKSNRFLVDLTYEKQWNVISCILNAGLDITKTKIPYMGSTLDIGKPSPYASIMIDGKFKKGWTASCGFDYVGKSYELMTVSDPTYNLTASISKSFLDKRLQVTLSGYDLIKGMKDVWHDRYGYYETFQTADRDRRYVRLSLKYVFNNFRNRYTASEESEEAQRL